MGYATLSILALYFFNGTAGSGDSVHHYLFAKYAPSSPHLFFNHWAKPLFVLLASPFSQFGFIGIKIFNALLTGASLYFTTKSVEKMELPNSSVVFILALFSPLFFVLTFSGLTEPLFAFFISFALFQVTKKNLIFASILVSFLPFIRSEGLIIIGVFALFFLFKKQWKPLVLLGFGHVAYSLAGWPFTGDLLWVFNKIPYAHLSSTYGSGDLFHFVDQLFYVVGAPIYILFMLGIVKIIIDSFQKKITTEIFIIVFLGTGAFILAHSLFWYMGIFNSMGLKRVLIAIIPLTSIIALIGYNFIISAIPLKNNWKPILHFAIIGLVLIFPFTSNPAAIDFKEDLMLTNDQVLVGKISKRIIQLKGEKSCVLHSNPYLSLILPLNHFDSSERKEFTQEYMSSSKSGDLLIWDSWFAVIEHGVLESELLINLQLLRIEEFSIDDSEREIRYVIFKRR